MALVLKQTDKTPDVHFDSERGIFIMDGLVLPEDAIAFFNPLINYLASYLEEPQTETRLYLKLDYFNTAASRLLYNFLKTLNDAENKTKGVVIWYYEEDDDDLEEVGDEFAEMMTGLEFHKHSYSPDLIPSLQDLIELV